MLYIAHTHRELEKQQREMTHRQEKIQAERLKMESDKAELEEAMQAVADEKAMFVDL